VAYTRVAPDLRRMQIIEATHRVTLERGLHDVRVSDVADDLDVSTGLIHYHFATKDELIEAMLREMADREVADVRRSLAQRASAQDRLARFIEAYLPSHRRDHTWLLWIDAWGEALRHVNLRRISEELDAAWVDVLAGVIADGVSAGVFRCEDAVATAWRLCALLDGVALQVVLHQSTMTRAQMHTHVRHAAALELGYAVRD
jgi:AcrR family transcriptional regulator